MVLGEDCREDAEERLSAGPQGGVSDLAEAVPEGQPVAFEVVEERAEQGREGVDGAGLLQPLEHGFGGNRLRRGVGSDPLGEALDQPPFGLLEAVGFQQDGAMLGMDLPFPLPVGEVAVAVDVGGGLQPFLAVGADALGEAEVLDVDAARGQAKVRSICPPAGRRDLVFVFWFVLIVDAVEKQPVGDLAFLEAPHRVVLEAPQSVGSDVV